VIPGFRILRFWTWNSAWQSYSAAFIKPSAEWNMKERLLITTAIGLMLGTGAFAQSPSDQQKIIRRPRRKAGPIISTGIFVDFFSELVAVCQNTPST